MSPSLVALDARFAGAALKLKRADLHFPELRRRTQRFTKSKPYRLRCELEDECRTHVLYVDRVRHPARGLSAIVGDIIHNVRSALDHLAYQVFVEHGGDPKKKPQFPIRDKKPNSINALLPGMPKEVLAVLSDLQPYNGAEPAIIRDLNNLDKHNLLVVVAASPNPSYIGRKEGCRGQIVASNTFWGPLRPNKQVGYIVFSEPNSEGCAYFDFDAQVTIEDTVATGETAVEVLETCIGWVRYNVMPKLMPLLPAHGWAPGSCSPWASAVSVPRVASRPSSSKSRP